MRACAESGTPGGISAEAYDYWVEAVGKVYDSAEWKEVMAQSGLAPLNLRGAEFNTFVAGSILSIQELSKEIGLIK